jgi:hypothetical protein
MAEAKSDAGASVEVSTILDTVRARGTRATGANPCAAVASMTMDAIFMVIFFDGCHEVEVTKSFGGSLTRGALRTCLVRASVRKRVESKQGEWNDDNT